MGWQSQPGKGDGQYPPCPPPRGQGKEQMSASWLPCAGGCVELCVSRNGDAGAGSWVKGGTLHTGAASQGPEDPAPGRTGRLRPPSPSWAGPTLVSLPRTTGIGKEQGQAQGRSSACPSSGVRWETAQCGLRGALGKHHPGLLVRPERNGPLRLPDPQRSPLGLGLSGTICRMGGSTASKNLWLLASSTTICLQGLLGSGVTQGLPRGWASTCPPLQAQGQGRCSARTKLPQLPERRCRDPEAAAPKCLLFPSRAFGGPAICVGHGRAAPPVIWVHASAPSTRTCPDDLSAPGWALAAPGRLDLGSGSSPGEGSRGGVGLEEQGPDCQPYSGGPRAGPGAQSPKACLRGAQDPCAHLLPGTYTPSSSDGAAGHPEPCVTGAAVAKMKFIFPTVADSWSGCGSRKAGKTCRHCAGRRPGRPSAHHSRAARARAASPRRGRQSGAGREPTGPGRRGIPARKPGPSCPAPRGCGSHPGCTRRSPNSAPELQAPHGPDSVSPRLPAGPEGADLPSGTAAESEAGAGVRSGSKEGAAGCRPTWRLRTARVRAGAQAPRGAREDEEAPPSAAQPRPLAATWGAGAGRGRSLLGGGPWRGPAHRCPPGGAPRDSPRAPKYPRHLRQGSAHLALAARHATGSPTEAACQSQVPGGPASRAVLAERRVGDPSGQLTPRTDAWGPLMAASSSRPSGIQSVPIRGPARGPPPGPQQRCGLSGLWAWTRWLQAAGLSAGPSFCPALSLLQTGGDAHFIQRPAWPSRRPALGGGAGVPSAPGLVGETPPCPEGSAPAGPDRNCRAVVAPSAKRWAVRPKGYWPWCGSSFWQQASVERVLGVPGRGLPGEQELWDPALLQSSRGTLGSHSASGPADRGLAALLVSRKPGSAGCCNLNTLSWQEVDVLSCRTRAHPWSGEGRGAPTGRSPRDMSLPPPLLAHPLGVSAPPGPPP
ncbi:collagen alpha-1(I) chain-like [Moschus berezovskii]|uniref:collagen alpha-1(I) chain-like n=1 Tax=Moschus berezovskii TaxID=68408 RepID=UPI0024443CD6|nr:collagen alpha-1(I) chain-like [Moschus berezovskii]